MNKKQLVKILLIAFFVGAIGSIFFQRVALPQLSTIPGLGFLRDLQSDSPIVITRYEQVQLNEGVNLIELTKQAQASTVSIYSGNQLRGSGVVMTGDGLIFSSKEVVGSQSEFNVVLNDGTNFVATVRALDPKSELALLTIPANNLAVAQLSDAASLQTAQRLFALGKTSHEFTRFFASGLVTKTVINNIQPTKTLSTEIFEETIATDADINPDFVGGPVINLEGKLVGMIVNSQNKILISEAIQGALQSYLANGKVMRPHYGIKYNSLSNHTAKLRQLNTAGALVLEVETGSAAQQAGLARNDYITKVNGQNLSDSSFEQVLSKTSGQLKLEVLRNNQTVELTLVPELR